MITKVKGKAFINFVWLDNMLENSQQRILRVQMKLTYN